MWGSENSVRCNRVGDEILDRYGTEKFFWGQPTDYIIIIFSIDDDLYNGTIRRSLDSGLRHIYVCCHDTNPKNPCRVGGHMLLLQRIWVCRGAADKNASQNSFLSFFPDRFDR